MERRALSLGSIVALAVALVACGGSQNEAAGPQTTQIQAATTAGPHLCPMSVQGSVARVVDVPGGYALELVTSSGSQDVTELRRRGKTMASQGSLGEMAGPGGGMGSAGRGRNLQTAARVSGDRVRAEDVPGGVRVIVLARDPARVDVMRARARAHAQRMASNAGCSSAASQR